MATKYSQDSLAPKGGDLGYFTKNQIFGAFSERAFNMKVNERVVRCKNCFYAPFEQTD